MTTKELASLKLAEEEISRLAQKGYSIGRALNSGGYAVVYRATYHERSCAAKVIELEEMRISNRSVALSREVFLLKTLQHPNIVPVLDLFLASASGKLIIFMELAEGGDLFDLMANRALDEPTTARYYRQIGSALVYVHSIGIAHRDLKPENILLDGSLQRCMLADFGAARLVYDPGTGGSVMSSSLVGTTITNAPEVLKTGLGQLNSYDPLKADVWSAGMVLFFMLHARYPYEPSRETERNVLTAQLNWTIRFRSDLSSLARSFILRHLIVDPKLRSTMERLMTDLWFDRAIKR